ncbi:MAG: helix-turn-helix transcriptional regulator [Bacillota bacterium]
MADTTPESLFLDTIDLARMFKVRPKTIAAWTKRGLLPAPLKIGRLVRWKRADLASMQARH